VRAEKIIKIIATAAMAGLTDSRTPLKIIGHPLTIALKDR
jgi:hypothetical protein